MNGPSRVLARGATPEVFAGDQNARALVVVFVQNEVRIGLAGVRTFVDATPVVEEEVAVPGALDTFEELLGNDLVRVDVGQRQGDGLGMDDVNRLHDFSSGLVSRE